MIGVYGKVIVVEFTTNPSYLRRTALWCSGSKVPWWSNQFVPSGTRTATRCHDHPVVMLLELVASHQHSRTPCLLISLECVSLLLDPSGYQAGWSSSRIESPSSSAAPSRRGLLSYLPRQFTLQVDPQTKLHINIPGGDLL